MLFNSIEYLLFLPVVFALYWLMRGRTGWQNLFIVIVSFIFYGWWDYRFLFLMSFTALCSFFSGILLERMAQRRGRRLVVTFSLLLNLGILVVFKYYNFFAESLAVIDVYRKHIGATRDVVAFFAFISFFPQLVAGPIERSTNLLPQFLHARKFDYGKAVDGLRQMLWGFFKKVVVADTCASAVNSIFLEAGHLDSVTLFYGAFLFTMQIYCDFSGYSDIAIGTARLFGISLMRNFNFPYFSRDIAEFWRKWHISLTTWFRDYIYIPLGGSRCGKLKGFRNTVVIFLTSGLWHGANWTFVAWGAYHAVLFLPLFLAGKNRKYTSAIAAGRLLPTAKELLQMLVTFVLVVVGWIIFRADNISAAALYVQRMFTCYEPVLPKYGKWALVWIVVLMIAEWLQRDRQHALQIEGRVRNRYVRYAIYYALIAVIIIFQGETAQFIYFQF